MFYIFLIVLPVALICVRDCVRVAVLFISFRITMLYFILFFIFFWIVNEYSRNILNYIGNLRFCLNLQIPGVYGNAVKARLHKNLGLHNCFLASLDQMPSGEWSKFCNSLGVAFKTYIECVIYPYEKIPSFRFLNGYLQQIADQCYQINGLPYPHNGRLEWCNLLAIWLYTKLWLLIVLVTDFIEIKDCVHISYKK